MSPIDELLSRLDKAKPNGKGKWQACCPAHADKQPSLSIKETSDGTVLLKCWAGCTVGAIASAVGLEIRDLFPGTKQQRRSDGRGLGTIASKHERAVYGIGLAMQSQDCRLSRQDQLRFELAKQRLGLSK